MNNVIRAVKGTHDLYGEQLRAHKHITDTARRVLESAGAIEVHTPIFEETQVFEKSVGASTDIVRKEMYTFSDRGGRHLTLRPEGTAGLLRAYIERGMKVWPTPVRLWTSGPMFRAENVQRGRQRQFHQVDYEVLGLESALIDAETIELMVAILRELGLESLKVRLGSVGDPEDRLRYNHYLRELLSPVQQRLSDDSRDRLTLNPMRILDSKNQGDREVLADIGVRPMLDFLGPAAMAHFEEVKELLEQFAVPFEVDPSIVRGLDYYIRTAFEVQHDRIGARSALGGGGRYDGLSETLGGPRVPAVGFAFGIERLLIAMQEDNLPTPSGYVLDLYLIPLDAEAVTETAIIASKLRPTLHVESAFSPKRPGKGLQEASKRGARFAGLLGKEEQKRGVLAIKNLETGEQADMRLEQVVGFVSGRQV